MHQYFIQCVFFVNWLIISGKCGNNPGHSLSLSTVDLALHYCVLTTLLGVAEGFLCHDELLRTCYNTHWRVVNRFFSEVEYYWSEVRNVNLIDIEVCVYNHFISTLAILAEIAPKKWKLHHLYGPHNLLNWGYRDYQMRHFGILFGTTFFPSPSFLHIGVKRVNVIMWGDFFFSLTPLDQVHVQWTLQKRYIDAVFSVRHSEDQASCDNKSPSLPCRERWNVGVNRPGLGGCYFWASSKFGLFMDFSYFGHGSCLLPDLKTQRPILPLPYWC